MGDLILVWTCYDEPGVMWDCAGCGSKTQLIGSAKPFDPNKPILPDRPHFRLCGVCIDSYCGAYVTAYPR